MTFILLENCCWRQIWVLISCCMYDMCDCIKVTVLVGDADEFVGSALTFALVYLWPWLDGLPQTPIWLQQEKQHERKTCFTNLLSVLFFVDVLGRVKVKDTKEHCSSFTPTGSCERRLVSVGKRHQTSLRQASDTAIIANTLHDIITSMTSPL